MRSSAASEDTATESNAGAFISIDGHSMPSYYEAIVAVFDSYQDAAGPDDQVLVQKSLTPVKVCRYCCRP